MSPPVCPLFWGNTDVHANIKEMENRGAPRTYKDGKLFRFDCEYGMRFPAKDVPVMFDYFKSKGFTPVSVDVTGCGGAFFWKEQPRWTANRPYDVGGPYAAATEEQELDIEKGAKKATLEKELAALNKKRERIQAELDKL